MYDVTRCPRSHTDIAENSGHTRSSGRQWSGLPSGWLRRVLAGASEQGPSTDSRGKQLGSEGPGVEDLRIKPELYLLDSLCLHLWKPSHAFLMRTCVCVCVCARAPVREVRWGRRGRNRFLFASSPFSKGLSGGWVGKELRNRNATAKGPWDAAGLPGMWENLLLLGCGQVRGD